MASWLLRYFNKPVTPLDVLFWIVVAPGVIVLLDMWFNG